MLAGERYYYINQRVYALQKGDLIWISKHDFHRTSNKGSGSHERILINFDEEFAASSMTVSPPAIRISFFCQKKAFCFAPPRKNNASWSTYSGKCWMNTTKNMPTANYISRACYSSSLSASGAYNRPLPIPLHRNVAKSSSACTRSSHTCMLIMTRACR
uniref:AraC family ligand binding domain-containing protein n=1 Tax=Paenibacillus polymyxa TaxID=1406 RepID=A0AAE9PUA6_PAEPO